MGLTYNVMFCLIPRDICSSRTSSTVRDTADGFMPVSKHSCRHLRYADFLLVLNNKCEMFSQYMRDKCCDSVAVTFQISIFSQQMQMRASCGTNAFDWTRKHTGKTRQILYALMHKNPAWFKLWNKGRKPSVCRAGSPPPEVGEERCPRETSKNQQDSWMKKSEIWESFTTKLTKRAEQDKGTREPNTQGHASTSSSTGTSWNPARLVGMVLVKVVQGSIVQSNPPPFLRILPLQVDQDLETTSMLADIQKTLDRLDNPQWHEEGAQMEGPDLALRPFHSWVQNVGLTLRDADNLRQTMDN